MADALWSWADLVAACRAQPEGEGRDVTGVSIDSRTLRPGELFVAIRGDRLDGHDYVTRAFEAGAAAALVNEDFAAAASCGPLLRTDDTLEALAAIGRAARARAHGLMIAVTGSVGKTGTKEALRLCLGTSGTVHAADKSFNNHWGVPLTLARLPERSDFGVFEVGMNHAGEITPLSNMVRPHIAIITTVEPVHIEFFDSVEAIAEAKAEIFAGLAPGGTAILNRDNPHFDRLKARAEAAGAGRIISFGADGRADVCLLDVVLEPTGSRFIADVDGRRVEAWLGAPGRHLVQNALAVLGACRQAGADLEAAAAALSDFGAPKGRGARSRYETADGPVLIIDESYNANPASLRAALLAMAQLDRKVYPRRIAVLGDMRELGEAGPELHRGLADDIAAAEIDIVHAGGPLMRALYDALPETVRGHYAGQAEALEAELLADVRGGDAVMLKGSLASRIGPLVDALEKSLKTKD